MADNDLTLAHSLQAAHTAIAVNILTAGAAPSTAASRYDLPFELGSIVRDQVSGQYAVVEAISVQDILSPVAGA